ncbi:hypothetical protein FNH09_18335 [Streptomyces adustus]|uniref:DUF4065 domain-containing protein n=1 Tax=Streptomyces adustus TaxID=1609272 RepID=A0A5N8VE74_9ACTN|nr:hypothetical protein [Streptomyces adustus]MPY33146.1 hypothetical protein [Streptomyces adustus]
MSQAAPEASFDALFVASELSREGEEVTLSAVQIFIYLACLLGLYDKKPVASWGYKFLSTPASSPWSMELYNAVEWLKSKRLLAADEEKFRLTPTGKKELELWMSLGRFSDRVPYLRGATGASAAMPVSSVEEGVSREPHLARAVELDVPQELLEDANLKQVYDQFSVLKATLGSDIPDYMVPAVVWLSFLLEQATKVER